MAVKCLLLLSTLLAVVVSSTYADLNKEQMEKIHLLKLKQHPMLADRTPKITSMSDRSRPWNNNMSAPESWPNGKYSLLRAGDECPEFEDFEVAKVYQDTEDYYNANAWPLDSGLKDYLKKDGVTFNYCTKTSGTKTYPWPKGNYCIVKRGARCPVPNKFQEGYIQWDDEDDNNRNKVQKPKYLPAGNFTDDITRVYYCCRDDGRARKAIPLPNTKPFYLYQYTSKCQEVIGMAMTYEHIEIDDEDIDNDRDQGGAHPKTTVRFGYGIHLCYYTPQDSSQVMIAHGGNFLREPL